MKLFVLQQKTNQIPFYLEATKEQNLFIVLRLKLNLKTFLNITKWWFLLHYEQ